MDDLVADIRANTSYASTAPTDITIDGRPGKQVDIQLPSDLDFASFDNETGDAAGNYFVFTPPRPSVCPGPRERWHARIIDVDGSRLIVLVSDFELTQADVRAEAQTIIDSITFLK